MFSALATNLALPLSSGFTGSHVIEATATAALESWQSLADDSEGVDWDRSQEAQDHQEAQNLKEKDDLYWEEWGGRQWEMSGADNLLSSLLSKIRAELGLLFADVLMSWCWL